MGWLSAWLFGAAGWWLGSRSGLPAAVIVSALTGAYGLYLGLRWFDQHLK